MRDILIRNTLYTVLSKEESIHIVYKVLMTFLKVIICYFIQFRVYNANDIRIFIISYTCNTYMVFYVILNISSYLRMSSINLN